MKLKSYSKVSKFFKEKKLNHKLVYLNLFSMVVYPLREIINDKVLLRFTLENSLEFKRISEQFSELNFTLEMLNDLDKF